MYISDSCLDDPTLLKIFQVELARSVSEWKDICKINEKKTIFSEKVLTTMPLNSSNDELDKNIISNGFLNALFMIDTFNQKCWSIRANHFTNIFDNIDNIIPEYVVQESNNYRIICLNAYI